MIPNLIFDLNSGFRKEFISGTGEPVQGTDYDFFCPVVTFNNIRDRDGHRGVYITNDNQRSYFEKCTNLDANPHCKSTKTLEQQRSPKLTLGNLLLYYSCLLEISKKFLFDIYHEKNSYIFSLDCKAKPVKTPGYPLEESSTCAKHIWRRRDNTFTWARGCKPFGNRRRPKYMCALYANSEGDALVLSECLPTNPEGCNMPKPRIKKSPNDDFVYPLLPR